MKLSDFDYAYPRELVAQRPLPERDASRMMVVDRGSGSWRHSRTPELPRELAPGDLLVINDSRVIPARLFGRRENGEAIELLAVEPREPRDAARGRPEIWRCLLKQARRIRSEERFFFGMHATAVAKGREGIFLLVAFAPGGVELAARHHGAPPLPPYIEREGLDAYTEEDRQRYQTIFATHPGSAAAPTAGLHFSEPLLEELSHRGIRIVPVTLHVGIDTFAPVRAETLEGHRMHGEHYEIPPASAAAIALAKREGRRVVAVGTTTVRALESAAIVHDGERLAWEGGGVAAGAGTTRLFITPGFRFQIADALLTNFHLPKSTLLVLVSAFAAPGAAAANPAGRELILGCYAEAIRERYRLFSYGDSMLIL